MIERYIWKNGKILPEKEAVMSIYSEGLMFGTCVFEMMRTFNRITFKLLEHIDRLFASCNALEIDMSYTKKQIYHEHENLILHNKKAFTDDDEVRTLINVERGTLPMYQEMLGHDNKPNVIIACFPLRHILKGKSKFYKQGVHAIIPSQRSIPEHLLDAKLKTRSRQHYMAANLEVARQDKEAWALMLDPDGFVTEGTGANFFIVSNNNFELYTPEPRNILRGISRDYVMKLARKLGMAVIERNITLYDVYNAREAFFTSTPYSILPCVSINGKPIGEGQVGKRTKYLTEKWGEEVGIDFVKQSEVWDAVVNN